MSVATSSRRSSTPRSRFVARTVRVLLETIGIVGVAVGFVLYVTSPDRGKRPGAASIPRHSSRAAAVATSATPAQALGPQIPLYSEDWLDDSGFGYARQNSLPITDPQSLEQLRSSREGREHRGIAKTLETMQRVAHGTKEGRARTLQLNIITGLLHMSAGEFAEADQRFALAQAADPACPPLLLANIEALRGVAALRRGEADNCVACCNESSCIFPLAASAKHLQPSGSLEAIRHFTAYLEQRPEDLGVRWLLNVAHMTLGSYPDGVPEAYLIPLPTSRSEGPVDRLINVASRVGLAARGANMAGGAIVDDFTGDGLFDIFTSTMDSSQGCALFVNRGDGTFEDRSTRAGLEPQVGALNCNHADFDNDGDLDILLLRGGWESPLRPSLLRNDGGGRFTDATVSAGLWDPIASQAAAWADFDCDGHVDLYVAGEFQPEKPDSHNRGRLYRNNGNGTFTDVADSAGVRNDRCGKGVAWGDYDDDGLPDLYVSNRGQANRLYHNNGDGTFTDVAERLGVTEPIFSFACWFWDYDNDGRLDLFVTGSLGTLSEVILSQLGRPTGGERPRLYHNEGGQFVDVARGAGLDHVWLPMGSNFGDIDGDGFLDIYLGTGAPPYSYLMPNVLLRNIGGRGFEDITVASGTGHLQKGHGVSFADWDRDGDVDLFFEAGGATPGDKAHNVLFENPGRGHRWLTLKLVGTRSNRAAIGARVRVDVSGPEGLRSIHRVIGGGSSFGNNPLTPTIGLGRAEAIASVEIRWPDGRSRQVARGVSLDCAIEIIEGKDGYRLLGWQRLPGVESAP